MNLFAADPLLEIGGVTLGDVAFVIVKMLIIFVVGLVGTMFMVWFERKIIAGMQNRVGPNKAGPVGSAADLGRRDEALLQRGPDP